MQSHFWVLYAVEVISAALHSKNESATIAMIDLYDSWLCGCMCTKSDGVSLFCRVHWQDGNDDDADVLFEPRKHFVSEKISVFSGVAPMSCTAHT